MANSKSRLGRGLGGLISGSGKGAVRPEEKSHMVVSKSAVKSKTKASKKASSVEIDSEPVGYRELLTSSINPNPYQPRKEIEPKQVEDLAKSIRSEGLLQPIVVRECEGGFELIAGERRLRAYEHLGIKEIPSRIIDATDASSAALALIENLQRENLNPIDEAAGYASLIRDFDLTQEAAAEKVGKGRATVANALRMLSLSLEVQGYLSKRLISTGHAKVILSLDGDDQQKLFARHIIESGMSVREAEKQVKKLKENPSGGSSGVRRKVTDAEVVVIRDLEKRIGEYFNTRVALRHGPKKGRLTIEYFGNEDLDRILDKIGLSQ